MSEKKIEAVNGHTLQKVFLSVEDHIAVMTLHNPPVNAADGVVQEEILLLCDYINHEDDIWVCIMHSDIKTFCVGVDIKRFYQSILDKLAETDTVVSISAGNSSSWPENSVNGTGALYLDDVNFATGGSPGSYKNSFGVASVDNSGTTG